jgi:hypothetical protein
MTVLSSVRSTTATLVGLALAAPSVVMLCASLAVDLGAALSFWSSLVFISKLT